MPDESHGHSERLEHDAATSGLEDRVRSLFDFGDPFMDSPRTVTSCASGVQNFTHARRVVLAEGVGGRSDHRLDGILIVARVPEGGACPAAKAAMTPTA